MINRELEYLEVTKNYSNGLYEGIIRTSMFPHEVDQLVRFYESQNMCCIVLPEELYFIDTLARVDLTKKFRRDMEERFSRPTTHLFLTHDHWHCTFGMSAFEDVTVVISSSGKAYYKTNLKKGRYVNLSEWLIRNIPDDNKLQKELLANQLFVPHVGVGKPRIFGPDGLKLRFEPIGFHSRPSSLIYLTKHRTLFTGGILNTIYGQFIWPLTAPELYKKIELMDVDYIVPGHGFVVDKNYVKTIRLWMEETQRKLWEMKKVGLTRKQVVNHPDLPEYPGKKQKSWIEGSNYHTGAVSNMIYWWYGQILKQSIDEEELMFLS